MMEESEELCQEKQNLRREILKKRASLSLKERERAFVMITDRLLGHQWFYRADTLLAFVGYGTEIDTSGIIREALRAGKEVFVPKVSGEEMLFYQIQSMEELSAGYKKIPEPAGDGAPYDFFSLENRRRIEENRTLLLMPGVAFDRCNGRLGYGKGFYDRFLSDKESLRLHSIGIGFVCQMVERVPCDEHDIKPYQIIVV